MMRGEESDGRVFKTVLFYCLLILVLPISTFFISKSLVFEWFLGQVRESTLDYGTLSFKERSHHVRYDQKSHLVEKMALVGECAAGPYNFNPPIDDVLKRPSKSLPYLFFLGIQLMLHESAFNI
jgi:hypothetical protein